MLVIQTLTETSLNVLYTDVSAPFVSNFTYLSFVPSLRVLIMYIHMTVIYSDHCGTSLIKFFFFWPSPLVLCFKSDISHSGIYFLELIIVTYIIIHVSDLYVSNKR